MKVGTIMANKLSAKQSDELLLVLEDRFNKNMKRHDGVKWGDVLKRCTPEKLAVLLKMEETGGEPDVVHVNQKTGEVTFFDCSKETPDGRKNLCYDREALEGRKKFPPENCALDIAKEIGIELLSEEQYRYLQELGEFDSKTSSWILTNAKVRKLGGALFCDRRYDTVFTYHNGAESYYSGRGFRGFLIV